MRQSLWRLRCGYMVKPVNLRRLMAGRLQRSMCVTTSVRPWPWLAVDRVSGPAQAAFSGETLQAWEN
jgi:hypothetical protein